jgi:hypothetical protein
MSQALLRALDSCFQPNHHTIQHNSFEAVCDRRNCLDIKSEAVRMCFTTLQELVSLIEYQETFRYSPPCCRLGSLRWLTIDGWERKKFEWMQLMNLSWVALARSGDQG